MEPPGSNLLLCTAIPLPGGKKELRSIRIQSLFIILTLIFIFAAPELSSADNESNDSLDDPEVLMEGSVMGHVEDYHTGDYPNRTYHEDNDIYKIQIPPGKVCEFRLKKMDQDEEYIQATGYDHDKIRIHGGFGIPLFVPGEVGSDTWENRESTAMDFYIYISGNGNYSLSVTFSNIVEEEEMQYHHYYDRPQIVNDGIYTNELPMDGFIGKIDTWYYLVTVPTFHFLHVNFEKVDESEGTLYLRSMDPDLEITGYETIDITLDQKGENRSGKWFNSYNHDDEILIKVMGKGSYKLIINTTVEGSIFDSELHIMLIVVSILALCLVSIFVLIPALIIIVVTVGYIKNRKKKKKLKANIQNSTFS